MKIKEQQLKEMIREILSELTGGGTATGGGEGDEYAGGGEQETDVMKREPKTSHATAETDYESHHGEKDKPRSAKFRYLKTTKAQKASKPGQGQSLGQQKATPPSKGQSAVSKDTKKYYYSDAEQKGHDKTPQAGATIGKWEKNPDYTKWETELSQAKEQDQAEYEKPPEDDPQKKAGPSGGGGFGRGKSSGKGKGKKSKGKGKGKKGKGKGREDESLFRILGRKTLNELKELKKYNK